MENKNLWNDAARYGFVIGLVSIGFNLLSQVRAGMLLATISLVVFLVLTYYFTKRRAAAYGNGEQGYGYGRCLVFILCMMLFAGFLEGAYQILASKWLFAEAYAANLDASLAMLNNTGFYTTEQLETIARMMRSPLVVLFSNILGSVIKGGFFGLFIAALAKREPNVFADGDSGHE